MTIKLTDAQLVILSAAARREDHAVLPLPQSLNINKETAVKVLNSLIGKQMIAEQPAGLRDEVWRQEGRDTRLTLAVTDKGLEAIGAVQEAKKPQGKRAEPKKVRRETTSRKKAKASTATIPTANARIQRPASKQTIIIDLLKREGGATIDDLVAATGWQVHSVRGAIRGTLKQKLGLAILSEVIDGRGRVYRIREHAGSEACDGTRRQGQDRGFWRPQRNGIEEALGRAL